MNAPVRIEHDLIGDRAVPVQAYYGVHTLRALENFPITGTSISILHANGDAGLDGERRVTNLEDVFVLLTGEEIT